MGTVGLSFGSPTSGAGFNVSATVSEIVANLQNVETPWKTQLTTLESQDTAISSLGTLFSNLSNDMSSNTNVLELTAASTSASAGTHTVTVNSLAQTSSGYLAEITNASDTLSGSITLKVGSGTAKTITLDSSENTLSGLASAINASGAGITASVLTDATGSRLSLVSGTSGAGGNIAISANSITAAAQNTLAYTGTAGTSSANSIGTLAAVSGPSEPLAGSISIQVGSGTSASVTMAEVSSAEGGTTLSDLETYIAQNTATLGVQASIVTNSDGTSSLSLESNTPGTAGTLTVNSSLTDSVTALGYTSAVTGSNAGMTVDGVNLTSASNTVTDLIPGVTFQLLSASSTPVQIVIGNDNTDVESTVNQFVSDYNSLVSALNTQEGNTSSGTPEPLFGSPTLTLLQEQLLGSVNTQNPNGYLDAVSSAAGTTLAGSLSIQVGSGTAETIQIGAAPSSPRSNTIYTGSGVNTLAGLAAAITTANIGVTAGVSTSDGESSLTLTSQTAGANGALTVTPSLTVTAQSTLTYESAGYTSTTPDTGTFGTGSVQTITLDSSDDTLSGLMGAINGLTGVTAAPNSAGTALTLTSGSNGSAGALTITSNIVDPTGTISTPNYNPSSDINNLTSLGISVNNDGSLTFDATSLDSVLNTDYGGVVGFFQNASSWGQSFSNMLTNAGSSNSTGILALASSSDSSTESTLNAEISKENSLISVEQSSLTTELNSANEVMEELPTQLEGVNELYSAITGYDQNPGG